MLLWIDYHLKKKPDLVNNLTGFFKRRTQHTQQLYWGFLCTFHSLQRTKKIAKSLQRKQRNCERTKMIILTVFMLELKDLIINFSIQ